MDQTTRRSFIQKAGSVPLIGTGISLLATARLEAKPKPTFNRLGRPHPVAQGSPQVDGFEPLPNSYGDRVDVAEGFQSYVLVKQGDKINSQGDRFGECCDYTAFMAGESPDQSFLWVNHEYINVGVLYGKLLKGKDKTKAQVDNERKLLGGSFLELKKVAGRYQVNDASSRAFRIDGFSKIAMVGPDGGRQVTGTMGNCSGGVTPWGTILSAEENVDDFTNPNHPYYYGWAEHYDLEPTDYGYIVEVDPNTKTARKLTGLGRFAHEGACIHVSQRGHVVAYMGDDARFECLYKFVSTGKVTGDPAKDRDLLVDGTLYVANLKAARWEKLSPQHPKLKKDGRFQTQKAICRDTRAAARIAGGTPLNRPEGITIDPASGIVLIALTNNSKSGDFHGSILSLKEDNGDHSGDTFETETAFVGGPAAGLSCPDNLTMGPGGYLWAGMDISSTSLGKGIYKDFPRNALHRIEPDHQGNLYARRLLLAPIGAEVTGPSFADDGQSLFVSMQHPGEGSFVGKNQLISRWPNGEGQPLSSVVVVAATSSSFS